MLFGSKTTFGIEAMAEPTLTPPSAVWGRMQIWCQGASIGDFGEAHCALYTSYLGFKALRLSLPTLWLPEFDNLSEVALWNHCDGLLYGFHGDVELEDNRTLGDVQRDAAQYSRFNFLTNWGEQFDAGGKSFILCTPGRSVQILNRSFPESLRRVASLSFMDSVIADFVAWFEGESERLQRTEIA